MFQGFRVLLLMVWGSGLGMWGVGFSSSSEGIACGTLDLGGFRVWDVAHKV